MIIIEIVEKNEKKYNNNNTEKGMKERKTNVRPACYYRLKEKTLCSSFVHCLKMPIGMKQSYNDKFGGSVTGFTDIVVIVLLCRHGVVVVVVECQEFEQMKAISF